MLKEFHVKLLLEFLKKAGIRSSLEWKDRLRYWGKKVEKASRFEREVELPLNEFKPANQNLKILKSEE